MNRYWGNHHRANGTEPARPRNVQTALDKYLKWNRWGQGKEETSSRGSVYWHRDDILYRNWKPVARCLFAEGEGTVMVKLYDEGLGWRKLSEVFDMNYVFNVHDIGVWGPAKGMQMGNDEFIDCMRMQWLSISSYMVDVAEGLSYDRCAEWVEKRGRVTPAGHKLHHDYQIDTRLDMITNMANDYHRFRELFNLGWADFPKQSLIGLYIGIVEAKAKVYKANEPKRERRKLRLEGVKALTQEATV